MVERHPLCRSMTCFFGLGPTELVRLPRVVRGLPVFCGHEGAAPIPPSGGVGQGVWGSYATQS